MSSEKADDSKSIKPSLHFVGFARDEYLSAVKIWGEPDFIHLENDIRLRLEIHESDTVIYANKHESRIVTYIYIDGKEKYHVEYLNGPDPARSR